LHKIQLFCLSKIRSNSQGVASVCEIRTFINIFARIRQWSPSESRRIYSVRPHSIFLKNKVYQTA